MSPSDERDLRDQFAALRDEEAASAPQFSGVLRGRPVQSAARPSRRIPVAMLATAAVVAAVVLVTTSRRTEPSMEEAIAQARSISSWTAPTDAWLTLSGLEIPNSVPSLSLSSVTLPAASTATTDTGESR